ncbi:aminotransferase class V-fold PLP-dependent enzyme [Paludibaculum fermentans]|uniref:aminotransferase class V-fold PLP-dependent enzyme n=1 Tax=Paludibaculum fermentans TaxID=1473598 RepID=UPI003EBA29B4
MSCYLNNAAEGWPKAPGVIEAIADSLAAPCRESERDAGHTPGLVGTCRQRVAALLGTTDATRVLFTLNATHALNIAILGLPLREGSLVVTSSAAHNAVLRPLERLRRGTGISLRIVRTNPAGGVDADDYAEALQCEPSLVVLGHRSNVTGHVEDIPVLFEQARAAGARTLLDAAQSVGHLDCRAGELHADMIAFSGHKGLHGPPGVGVLYVAPGLELDQTIVGGTGSRSDLPAHPPEMPTRLEAGTPNLTGLAGLEAALAWHEQRGAEHRQRERAIALALRDGLRGVPGLALIPDDDRGGGIVSFRLEGWRPEELGHCLQESFGLICRSGLHCAPLIHQAMGTAPEGTVRFSVSGFTTEREIGETIDAVARVSRCTSLSA